MFFLNLDLVIFQFPVFRRMLGFGFVFFSSSSSSFYVIFMSFDVDSVCGELQLSYLGFKSCLLNMAWLF
jgi:hypothetical protein